MSMTSEELRLLARYAQFGVGHSPGWDDEAQALTAAQKALTEADRLDRPPPTFLESLAMAHKSQSKWFDGCMCSYCQPFWRRA